MTGFILQVVFYDSDTIFVACDHAHEGVERVMRSYGSEVKRINLTSKDRAKEEFGYSSPPA